MRRLDDFLCGAHYLPFEKGRRLVIAQGMRICPLCTGMHVGVEWQSGV